MWMDGRMKQIEKNNALTASPVDGGNILIASMTASIRRKRYNDAHAQCKKCFEINPDIIDTYLGTANT